MRLAGSELLRTSCDPLWRIRVVFADGIPDATNAVRAQDQESARHRELLNSLVTVSVEKTDGQVGMRTVGHISSHIISSLIGLCIRGVQRQQQLSFVCNLQRGWL